MKNILERTFISLFFLFLGYMWVVASFNFGNASENILLFDINSILSSLIILLGSITFFLLNAFYFVSKDGKFNLKRFTLVNLLLLLTFYFPAAYLFLLGEDPQSRQGIADLSFGLFVHPIVLSKLLPGLIGYLLAGVVYGYVRKLHKKALKKVIIGSSSVVVVMGIVFLINYQMDVSYQGNEKIRFLDTEFTTLEELVRQPQFEDKVVLVDFWYSNCSPCRVEFNHTPELKKKLAGKDVEFLYIARETSDPNSRQLWKNVISDYNLEGWHIYLTNPQIDQVWKTIEPHVERKIFGFPHYLLVDKNGQIRNYKAKKPSTGQALIQQIDALLKPVVSEAKNN